jgi:hypothetical protein
VSLARSGHLPRPRESGPYGRSDGAALPDSLHNVGNGFAGNCRWQTKPLNGGEMLIGRILGKQRPPNHTEETAMHPTIIYYLAQARMADLRHSRRRTHWLSRYQISDRKRKVTAI